jgi:hypothetical protein
MVELWLDVQGRAVIRVLAALGHVASREEARLTASNDPSEAQ